MMKQDFKFSSSQKEQKTESTFLQSTIFLDGTPCSQKSTDVSEDHIVSIFRVEGQTKRETSKSRGQARSVSAFLLRSRRMLRVFQPFGKPCGWNPQHLKRPSPESRNSTLRSSRENLTTKNVLFQHLSEGLVLYKVSEYCTTICYVLKICSKFSQTDWYFIRFLNTLRLFMLSIKIILTCNII
jgi:hypothetical protein